MILLYFLRRLKKTPTRCFLTATIFLSLLVSFSSMAEKPELEWMRSYRGEGSYKVFVETPDGYLLGSHASDHKLLKTDKSGNLMWTKTYGGSGLERLDDIIATSDGGFLLAGSSNSPVSGDKTSPSRGDYDIWIVKISATGTKLWDKVYGGSSGDYIFDIIETANGNFLLAGSSSSGVSGERSEANRTVIVNGKETNTYDYWLLEIDSQGNKIWDKAYGGGGLGSDWLLYVLPTEDGGYLLCGESSSDVGYEKTSDALRDWTSGITSDIWIIKTDYKGNKQWDKRFGGQFYDKLIKFIEAPDGDFLISYVAYNEDTNVKTVWYNRISQTGESKWEKPGIDTEVPYDFNFLAVDANASGFFLQYEIEYRFDASGALHKYDWNGDLVYKHYYSPPHYSYTRFFEIGKEGEFFFGHHSNLDNPPYPDYANTNAFVFSKLKSEEESQPTLNIGVYNEATESAYPFINYTDHLWVSMNVSSLRYTKVELYDNEVKVYEGPSNIGGTHQLRLGGGKPGVHHLVAIATDVNGKIVLSKAITYTVFANPVLLYKAINLNDSSKKIDIINYQSSFGLADFTYQAKSYTNQSIPLTPQTNTERAELIRSTMYGTASAPATFTLSNVPEGEYEVYMYTWEDNYRTTFSINLEGQTVLSNYNSGSKGQWKKLGPFVANVADGDIQIKTSGGDANISAIEIWKVNKVLNTAFNVNGPELIIDGVTYKDGRNNSRFKVKTGRPYENQSIALIPSTDASKAQMIRSSVYSTKTVPSEFLIYNLQGKKDIYLYVWEDNYPSTFSMKLGGKELLTNYTSGAKGTWAKIGPLRAEFPGSPTILQAYGGDANISGIEIWDVNPLWPPIPNQSPIAPQARLGSEEIDEPLQSGVNVYPVPAHNTLNINLSDFESGMVSFSIADTQGQVHFRSNKNLISEKSFQINTADLKAGLYILKIKTASMEKTVRFTKE